MWKPMAGPALGPFSQPLALVGGSVDRAGHLRGDPGWLAAARGAGESLAVRVCSGRYPAAIWESAAGVDETGDWLFLGLDGSGAARFAVVTQEPDHDWVSLRDTAGALSPQDGSLLAAAVALSNWHATHTHCPRCGTPTRIQQAGWTRRCPQDGSEHYPRTDPAVIMAVLDDDDRLLLGRGTTWAENRFSTLAGFVEPAESFEAAVRREVLEEVGVHVGDVQYLASQPWPFPASEMIGCRAQALDTTITIDPNELAGARWFTRDQLRVQILDGTVVCPRTSSISRRLIEHWFGRPLPDGSGDRTG